MTHYMVCVAADGSLTVASDCEPTRSVESPWRVVSAGELEQLKADAEANIVPPAITARQARLWLVQHGVSLAAVDAAIASIPDAVTRESVRVEWEYGVEVHRASPWLAALGPALGLDDATLDNAFREAAGL